MGIRVLALVALVAVATGCSGFRGEWKRATAQPAPVGDFTGPWEGTWLSTVNGHTDKLYCVVTKQSPTQYEAFFKGKYLKIFSYSHRVPLEVTSTNEVYTFNGSADLGIFGGVYEYNGRATPEEFRSSFTSKKNKGLFEMTRPTQK